MPSNREPYKVFGQGWGELFDAVWWHCGVDEPTHDAPDGSGYLQKGWDGTETSAIHGEWWIRKRGRWVRLVTGNGTVDITNFGGVADVRYGIASTTAGNATVTLSGLTPADVGKRIVLRAAGAGPRALTTVHISFSASTTTIAADAAIAATTIQVASSAGFVANDAIKMGAGTLRFESAVVLSIPDATHITLKAGLKLAHTAVQADVVEHASADHFTCAQTLTNADMGRYIEIAGAGVAGGILRGEIGDVGGQIGSALAVGDNRVVLPGYAVADTAVSASTATIGGDQLITTIVDVSGSSVTLAVAPSTTLAQSNAMWCTPNNAALTAALLAGTSVIFPEQPIGSIYGFDTFTLTDEGDTLLPLPGVAFAVTGPFALDANATRIHGFASGAIIRGFDPQHATFRYWGPNGPYIGTQPRCVQVGATADKAVTANELWNVSINNEVRAVHATGLGVGRTRVGVDTFVMKHIVVTDFHYGVGTGVDVTGATQTCWFHDVSVYATTGDDGQGGGFGRGVGIRIAGDPADPSGAVTANWWKGGLVQNYLKCVQFGNPGPNGNVTTTTFEDYVLESMPIRDAVTFDCQQLSNSIIRGHHFEGTAFEDGSLEDPAHLSIGFQLGIGPKAGTTTRVTIVSAGALTVPVASSAGFVAGDQVLIGAGTGRREAAQILTVPDGTHLAITEPLKFAHSQTATTVNGTATSGTNVIPVVSTAGFNLLDTIVIGAGTAREEFATIFAFPTGTSIQIYNPPLTFTHTAVQADVVQQSETVTFPASIAQKVFINNNKALGGVAVMFRADFVKGIFINNNSLILENADPVHAPGVVFNNRQLGSPSRTIYFNENEIDQAVTGVIFDDLTGVVLNENHVFSVATDTYDPHFWYYGTGHWLRLQGPTTWVSGTFHRITGDWTMPGGLFEIGRTGEGDGDGANAWDLSRLIGTNAAFTWTLPDGGFTPNWNIDNGAFTILPKYAATVGTQNRLTGFSMTAAFWDVPGVASVAPNFRIDITALSHNPLSTVAQYQYRGHRIFDADDAGQFFLGAKDGDGPALLFGTGDPNGVRAAPPSSVYHRQDNGSYWLKVSGTGNTVWSLIAAGGPFVPLSATVQGTAPIQIAGDNAAHDLSVPRTWSILNVSDVTAGAAPVITAASTLLWSAGGTSAAWATLATIGIVPTSSTLTGTAPITIDGVNTAVALTAPRTIAINNVSSSGPGAAGIITAAGTIFSSPLGVVGSWNTPATLGIVTTSYTLSTSGPITLDGTPGGSGNLGSAHTIGVLSATTSGLGVIQLADDLGGTDTAPDVIAASGLSGTFTVRCTHVSLATDTTIDNVSGNILITPTAQLILGAGTSASLSGTTAVTVTSGADVTIGAAVGSRVILTVFGSEVISCHDGGTGSTNFVQFSGHRTTDSPIVADGNELGVFARVNGVDCWVIIRRLDGSSTPP